MAGSVLPFYQEIKMRLTVAAVRNRRQAKDQVRSLGLWLQLIISYDLKYSCSARLCVAAQFTGCLVGRSVNHQCRRVTHVQLSFQLVA